MKNRTHLFVIVLIIALAFALRSFAGPGLSPASGGSQGPAGTLSNAPSSFVASFNAQTGNVMSAIVSGINDLTNTVSFAGQSNVTMVINGQTITFGVNTNVLTVAAANASYSPILFFQAGTNTTLGGDGTSGSPYQWNTTTGGGLSGSNMVSNGHLATWTNNTVAASTVLLTADGHFLTDAANVSFGMLDDETFEIKRGASSFFLINYHDTILNVGPFSQDTQGFLIAPGDSATPLFWVNSIGNAGFGIKTPGYNVHATGAVFAASYVCAPARSGFNTLTNGTVTVANTLVTANSIILFSSVGSATNAVGALTVAPTPATGFTINSTVGADTNEVRWIIIEKGP